MATILYLVKMNSQFYAHVHTFHSYHTVFEIKLGTVDQTDIDVEWRLRPYMNTAKKRLAISTTDTALD